jgi:gliding motility-associated protein GldM
MASGKLTPRQKMINMMYLVLTALLALNVSAEILDSFRTIANSLRLTAQQLEIKNRELAGELVEILNDQASKGKDKNQYLRPYIEDVRTKSNEMVAYLENHINRIKSDSIAGWDTTKNGLAKPDESSKNYRYWMIGGGKDTDNDKRGAGEAMPLKDRLNGYAKWASDFKQKILLEHPLPDEKTKPDPNKIWFSPIAVDPALDETVPKNSDSKKHTWEYYTFHGAPAIANVAMLEKWKTDAKVIESQLLEFIKTRIVDRPPFIIKKLEAIVAPKSEVVLAGMMFEAKVFVTMAADKPGDRKPIFSGTGVKADKSGMTATIKIPANASYLKTKDQKQPYSGTIKYPKAEGDYETINFKGSFIVRKPEAVFESAKMDPLYLNCANELNVDVPALGELYDPDHTAEGGEVLINKKSPKRVMVIPTKPKFVFNVRTKVNGQTVDIDKREFRVLKPPVPEIEVKVNGKEWNPQMKISPDATVRVYAKADPQFASALPKDARYRIEGLQVKIKPGIGPFRPAGINVNKSEVSSKPFVEIKVAQINGISRGTMILFEVEKVNRINYKDQAIEEEIPALQRSPMGSIE